MEELSRPHHQRHGHRRADLLVAPSLSYRLVMFFFLLLLAATMSPSGGRVLGYRDTAIGTIDDDGNCNCQDKSWFITQDTINNYYHPLCVTIRCTKDVVFSGTFQESNNETVLHFPLLTTMFVDNVKVSVIVRSFLALFLIVIDGVYSLLVLVHRMPSRFRYCARLQVNC
jgi:hypothetical protein